jgi:hypothetical protein
VSVTISRYDAAAKDRYREGALKGMDAASNHLRVSLQKAFGSWYYKGGRFRSTLQVKQSIRRDGPTWAGEGWEATVGTNKIEALYWELGHHNVFTRKYERVEIWVPTGAREVQAMRDTFARVVARMMGRPTV